MPFVKQLEKDTGLEVEDLQAQMIDRDVWKEVVGRGDEVPPTQIDRQITTLEYFGWIAIYANEYELMI